MTRYIWGNGRLRVKRLGLEPHTDKDSFRYRAQIVGPMQLTESVPKPLPPAVRHLEGVGDHSSSSGEVKNAFSYSLLTPLRLVVLDYSAKQQLQSDLLHQCRDY
jgi:hypothetical protein